MLRRRCPIVWGVSDISARLAAVDESQLTRLGFRSDDRRDVLALIEKLAADPDRMAQVEQLARRLQAAVGDFTDSDDGPFAIPAAEDTGWGIGALPMLA